MVNERIETVKNYLGKLDIPEAEKEQYTTIDGVQKAWNIINQANTPSTPKATSPNFLNRNSVINQSQQPQQPKQLDVYNDLVKADKETYQKNIEVLAVALQAQYFENYIKNNKGR